MINEYSAGAIIYKIDKGIRKYLLLHYVSGHWEFARGHIEKEEEIKDTVRREIREETGLENLEFIPGFEAHNEFYFKREDGTHHKDVTLFLAKTEDENIELGSPHEHQGYDWLPYDEAVEKLTFENAKEVLRQAEEFLNINKYK